MESLTLDRFIPMKSDMAKLAGEARELDLPNPFDVEQYGKVKAKYKELVKGRGDVKRTGLDMRDGANVYRTKVLDIEKDILNVTAEQEERLAKLLEEADKAIERKAPVELLPASSRR